jgi:hypothetical protein
MKILFILFCLVLSSCSYNIDNSIGGNYTNTVTGNTFRNSTPISSPPAMIINTYAPYWTYPYYQGYYGGFPWVRCGW